jgi:hypothetical protein
VLERQGHVHMEVKIQYNLEFQSLTLSLTQLQIDVQDAYEIKFECSTYARKEDEINFPMDMVPSPTKIRLNHNF